SADRAYRSAPIRLDTSSSMRPWARTRSPSRRKSKSSTPVLRRSSSNAILKVATCVFLPCDVIQQSVHARERLNQHFAETLYYLLPNTTFKFLKGKWRVAA